MGNQIVFNAETAETALNNTGLIGLSNTSEVKTMPSLEIAELTGKRHIMLRLVLSRCPKT